MVNLTKSYNRRYGFWLAGYYDDFNGARAITNDDNVDLDSAWSHSQTHYGNSLSKEAILNPRYRFGYSDRVRLGNRYDVNPAVTALEGLGYFVWSKTTDSYLRNKGLHEWLTHDGNRANSQHWEGHAQLQVPDWKNSNKYYFGGQDSGGGSNGYMMFGNGHNTQGVYTVPLAVEPSYGRDFFVAWDALDARNLDYSPYAGCPKQYSDGSEQWMNLVQCNITSVLMGFKNTGGTARTDAGTSSEWTADRPYTKEALFPLKSPSGMPFLVHDFVTTSTGTQRVINYDSYLKCKGIGDVFTIRMSHHAQGNFTSSSDPTYSLKVGFISSATYSEGTTAWSQTTPCVTCNFTPTDIGLEDGLTQWNGNTEVTGMELSTLWKDIEIIFDFTAQTWKAYLDGADFNTPFKSGSMGSRPGGGVWTASDLKGWALDVTVGSLGSDAYAAITTCIDRAAVYFPLTNPTDDTNTFTSISTNTILGFKKLMKTNTISSLQLTVEDDDNSRLLLPLVTETGLTDWSLIMFRDNQDRPIWRGPIEKIDIKQDTKAQTTEITIRASDSLSLLDRQLPLWEYGSNATTSMGDFVAMQSSVNTRLKSVQNIRDKMMLGATRLQLTSKNLSIDQDSSYEVLPEYRNTLYSGHPLQMYVDEDRAGPNEAEMEWMGKSDEAADAICLSEILFVHKISHVTGGGPYPRIAIAVPIDCAIAAGNVILLQNCGNDLDGSYNVDSVKTYVAGDFYFDGAAAWGGAGATSGIDYTPYTVCNNRDHEAQNIPYKVIVTTGGRQDGGDTGPDSLATALSSIIGYTEDTQAFVREDVGGRRYFTQKLWKCNMMAAHGLEVGDEVIFGERVATNTSDLLETDLANTDLTFEGVTVRVIGVPSATSFQFIMSRHNAPSFTDIFKDEDPATPGYITFNTNQGLTVLRMDKWGHTEANKRTPNHKAYVMKTAYTDHATLAKTKNRVQHARWMRDLSTSLWFKARFGIISDKAHWRTGAGTFLKNPVLSAVRSTYTSAGLSTTAGWFGLNDDYVAGTTTITMDEPGIWYWLKVRGKDGIFDFVDIRTGERDVVLGAVASNPSSHSCSVTTISADTPTGWTGSFTKVFSAHALSGIELWDTVVHTGFPNLSCNGVFQVVDIYASTGSVIQYQAIKIEEFGKLDGGVLAYLGAGVWGLDNTFMGGTDADGIVPFVEKVVASNRTTTGYVNYPVGSVGGSNWNAAGQVPYNTAEASGGIPAHGASGTVYVGNFNLSVKGLTRKWEKRYTQVTLRKIDNSNLDEVTNGYDKASATLKYTRGAYKHIFVLWADMRSDGTANADGGQRKNEFGLLQPAADNYSLKVLNTGQMDSEGNYQTWGELKVGEDFDIWEFDSQSEPFTGGDWSAIEGGSNQSFFTEHRNWDETGGSFVVIDLSRYYNLNTMANEGRAGYRAGGLASFEDYGDYAVSATPYLVDSYWKEATATVHNTGGASNFFDEHENQFNLFNDSTTLTNGVSLGQNSLVLTDSEWFTFATTNKPGYGTLLCKKGDEIAIYNFRWTGCVSATNTLSGVFINHYSNALSPTNVRHSIDVDIAAGLLGSQVTIDLSESGFDEVIVYNTPAALVALKVQMFLDGFIKNPNSGTYWESDKIRFLQCLAYVDSWTRTHFLSTITDICNTPITREMTLTQTDYNADYLGSGLGDTDSFGSIIDAGTSTTLEIMRKIQGAAGSGQSANTSPFLWGIGRDNRFELRPTYSLNHAFTRSNVKSANLTSNMSGNITNVRVFYNGNTSYADFPSTNEVPAASRWKIIEHENVTSKAEAEALAKKEFARSQKGNLTIKAELIRDGTTATLNPLENHIMLGGGRYGYIADTYVKTLAQTCATEPTNQWKTFGIPGMLSWSSRWGGTPVNRGIVNATQGAPDGRLLGAALSNTNLYGNTPGQLKGLTPSNGQATSHHNPLQKGALYLGTISGENCGVHGTARGSTAAREPALWGFERASSGTTYQAKFRRSAASGAWEDLMPAVFANVSAGDAWITHGLDTNTSGADDTWFTQKVDVSGMSGADATYAACASYVDLLPPSNVDKFNGANSVSMAAQIVHIPKNTPYVSAATGEEMRVAIAINNSGGDFSSIDDILFDVIFLDYSYASTTGTLPAETSATYTPTRTATLNAFSKVTVKGNGFYEVAFPANYGATADAKMVISVNTDYLRGIIRNRFGLSTDVYPPTLLSTTYRNNNFVPGATGSLVYPNIDDTNYISPFPLGMHDCYDIFGPQHNRSYMSAFTAPRVHIVDDISWMPSTTVTYTDGHLDILNQKMVVESVAWDQTGREHETVNLVLQKDAEQYNYDFVRMFGIGGRPGRPGGPTPKPKPRPPGGLLPQGGFNKERKNYGEEEEDGAPRPSFTQMGAPPDTLPSDGGIKMNDLSKGIHRSISGVMEIGSDDGAMNGSWGIPGQKRPSRTTTADLSIDGFDTVPEAGDGNSLMTTDGFSLPGIANAETGANGEYHTHTMKVRVPEGAIHNMVGVDGQISLGTHTGSGYITTTVKCIETDESVARKIAIPHGTTRTFKNLLPMMRLSGAGTAGNTLEITFERTPGDGTDTCLYSAIIVHNVSLKTRRGTNAQRSTTDRAFRPY